MVGEHCNRQSAVSEDNSMEQEMDCDQCLYIDESSRQSVTENTCSSQSGESSPECRQEADAKPAEPASILSELSPENGEATLSLPKNPKTSLSKLESLVSNLMQRKTEKLAQIHREQNRSASRAAASDPVRQKPVEAAPVTRSPSKRVSKASLSRSARSKISRVDGQMPARSVPDLQSMPQVPAFPPAMPGGMSPFIPPFGFPPFGFPPFMMPPVLMPPIPIGTDISSSSEVQITPSKVIDICPSYDMPLDLSTSGKKHHPDPGYPEHDLSRLSASHASPASYNGLLQVRVPQLVMPDQVTKQEFSTISSPKPSVLPRSGKSAFVNFSSPTIERELQTAKDLSGTSLLERTVNQQTHVKEMSIYEHNVLQTEFLDAARKPKTGAAIRRLQQSYRQEVDRIEMDRHKMTSSIAGDLQKAELQPMFDKQRLLVTKQFKVQLIQEKLKLGMKCSRQSTEQMPAVPPTMPFPGMPAGGAMFPSPVGPFHGMPTPNFPSQMYPFVPQMMPVDRWQQNHPVSSTTHSDNSPSSGNDSSSGGELNPDESQRSLKRKFLSPSAVGILNQWYDSHFDHPYPDEATVDDLAKQGNITPPQVKKWMANKRVRSCNTLAFNGSIHPKKLQKLMQLKESSLDLAAMPAVARTPVSDKKSKRQLNPRAVEYMSNWYAEHLNYPYPTEDEKSRIAGEAGLSLPQVTCWFANKRNRSNNTRRISTKTMWQKLNHKMEIMDAMNSAAENVSLSVKVEMPLPTNGVA